MDQSSTHLPSRNKALHLTEGNSQINQQKQGNDRFSVRHSRLPVFWSWVGPMLLCVWEIPACSATIIRALLMIFIA